MPWRRLALPLGLVTAGLALVSALELAGVHAYLAASPAEKVAGLLAACAAVVLWTWYALANAGSWPGTDTVSPAGWSTAVGVATGAVALPACPLPRSPASSARRERAPAAGQAGGRGRLPRRRGLLGGNVAVEPGLEPAVARRGRAAGQPRDRERLRLRLRGGARRRPGSWPGWPSSWPASPLPSLTPRAAPAYRPPDLLRSGLCFTAGPPRRRASTNCWRRPGTAAAARW